MPRRKHDEDDEDDFFSDDSELEPEEEYAAEYGDDALDELYELMEEFPELDEYLDDDFMDLDDADFYGEPH